jgi:hypothetical protein
VRPVTSWARSEVFPPGVLLLAGAVLGLACNSVTREVPQLSAGPGAVVDSALAETVSAPITGTAPDSLLITPTHIGRFVLGATLADARGAHPGAGLARVSDGEGVALVEATLAGGEAMILYAGEEDPEAAIDWTRAITTIEVFDPAFRTAEGVHPGSPVEGVERVWGRVRGIFRSEIESRQYIEFERQPMGFMLRLNDMGRFAEGSRVTTTYEPGAKIYSIAISTFGLDRTEGP